MMQTSERIASVPSFSGAWEVREQTESIPASQPSDTPGSPSNALRMRLRDWLLLIPDYDGCPQTLERFANSVRYVAARIGEGAERTLLLGLGVKLRGSARTFFQHKLHRHSSLEDFLSGLHARFSGVGSESLLLERLHCARQYGHESVGQYAARLDKLATQICTIYGEDREVEARNANLSLVRDIALASFRRGLNRSELEVRVNAYEPKNLEEAINAAIAVENELRFSQKLLRQMRDASGSTYKTKRRYR